MYSVSSEAPSGESRRWDRPWQFLSLICGALFIPIGLPSVVFLIEFLEAVKRSFSDKSKFAVEALQENARNSTLAHSAAAFSAPRGLSAPSCTRGMAPIFLLFFAVVVLALSLSILTFRYLIIIDGATPSKAHGSVEFQDSELLSDNPPSALGASTMKNHRGIREVHSLALLVLGFSLLTPILIMLVSAIVRVSLPKEAFLNRQELLTAGNRFPRLQNIPLLFLSLFVVSFNALGFSAILLLATDGSFSRSELTTVAGLIQGGFIGTSQILLLHGTQPVQILLKSINRGFQSVHALCVHISRFTMGFLLRSRAEKWFNGEIGVPKFNSALADLAALVDEMTFASFFSEEGGWITYDMMNGLRVIGALSLFATFIILASAYLSRLCHGGFTQEETNYDDDRNTTGIASWDMCGITHLSLLILAGSLLLAWAFRPSKQFMGHGRQILAPMQWIFNFISESQFFPLLGASLEKEIPRVTFADVAPVRNRRTPYLQQLTVRHLLEKVYILERKKTGSKPSSCEYSTVLDFSAAMAPAATAKLSSNLYGNLKRIVAKFGEVTCLVEALLTIRVLSRGSFIFTWAALFPALIMTGHFLAANHTGTNSVRRVLARKLYHLACCVGFIPMLSINKDMTALALAITAVTLAFVTVEALRVSRLPHPGISACIAHFCDRYLDDRDRRGVIATHIYLLLGIVAPIIYESVIAPIGCRKSNLFFAAQGLLTVGVADSAAAVVGLCAQKFGISHPMRGNRKKTVEGTVAFAFSYVLASELFLYVAYNTFDGSGLFENSTRAHIVVLATGLFSAMFEAIWPEIDNLILPLFALTFAKIVDYVLAV